MANREQYNKLRQAVNNYRFSDHLDAGTAEKERGGRLLLDESNGFTYGFHRQTRSYYAFDQNDSPLFPFCPVSGCDDTAVERNLCTKHHPMFRNVGDRIRDMTTTTSNSLLFRSGQISSEEIRLLFRTMHEKFGTTNRETLAEEIGKNGFFDGRLGVSVLRYKDHSTSLTVTTLDGMSSFETCSGEGCYMDAGICDEPNRRCSDECRRLPDTQYPPGSELRLCVKNEIRLYVHELQRQANADQANWMHFLPLYQKLWAAGRRGVPLFIRLSPNDVRYVILSMTSVGLLRYATCVGGTTKPDFRYEYVCQNLSCFASLPSKRRSTAVTRCTSCVPIDLMLIANGQPYEFENNHMVANIRYNRQNE